MGLGLKAHAEPDAGKGAMKMSREGASDAGGLVRPDSLCRHSGPPDTVVVPDLGAVQLALGQKASRGDGGLFTLVLPVLWGI